MLCERGERNESLKETNVRTKLAMMVQSREDDVRDPPLCRETNVAGSEEKGLNFFHEGGVSEVETEQEKRHSSSYMYESRRCIKRLYEYTKRSYWRVLRKVMRVYEETGQAKA